MQTYTIILLVVALAVLGLSIWAFVTRCNTDKFGDSCEVGGKNFPTSKYWDTTYKNTLPNTAPGDKGDDSQYAKDCRQLFNCHYNNPASCLNICPECCGITNAAADCTSN